MSKSSEVVQESHVCRELSRKFLRLPVCKEPLMHLSVLLEDVLLCLLCWVLCSESKTILLSNITCITYVLCGNSKTKWRSKERKKKKIMPYFSPKAAISDKLKVFPSQKMAHLTFLYLMNQKFPDSTPWSLLMISSLLK